MNKRSKLLSILTFALLIALSFTACSDDDNGPRDIPPYTIAKHIWETTEVTNHLGEKLDLNTSPANTYTGYAYYKTNRTFRFVSTNDETKMFGEWYLIDEDTKRHIAIYDSENKIIDSSNADILELTNEKFSYRVYPNDDDLSIYYDIVQTASNHPEPPIPAETLAAAVWTTSNVYDITNYYSGAKGSDSENNPLDPSKINEVEIAKANLKPLDNALQPAIDYVGDSYYENKHGNAYFPYDYRKEFANGTFKITELVSDSTITTSQGNWYVSVDAKLRTMYVKNGATFSRNVVSIHQLTKDKFTYDIVHNTQVLRVEHTGKVKPEEEQK